MSWMKRRGQPSPSPANPGVPLYNPNQHSNPQQPYQQWPQQTVPQQYNNDWYNQSRVPNKTPPAQQYPQPNTNNYWQQQQQPQSFNQPPPPPTYNTNIPGNQPVNQYQQFNQYPNNQQQQPNYYPNTGYAPDSYTQQAYPPQPQKPYQQNIPQQNVHNSNSPGLANQISAQPSEADPWNWGWDDNTNSNAQPTQVQPQKEIVNQNNIADSFANDESWNWTVEESNAAQSTNQAARNEQIVQKTEVATSQNLLDNQHTGISKAVPTSTTGNYENDNIDRLVENTADSTEPNTEFYHNPTQSIDTLEDLPSMPALRRLKNDLTPQWSIESQVSQDSSEDVLLTSESDNRSNVLSQSSTTSQSPSRPTSTHDSEYIPPGFRYDGENLPMQPNESVSAVHDEPRNSEYYQENSQSCVDNVDRALQELSLSSQVENKEIVSPEVASQPLKDEIQQPVKEPTPPPPPKKMTPPLMPPPMQGSSDANKNPFARTTTLSHKSANKMLAPKEPSPVNTVTQNPEPSPMFMQNAPSAFSMPVTRAGDNLGVNLETLPDNSERPDQLPVENVQKTVRKTSTVQQQWAENCEIAPINDRNQYLETGQLSDADVPAFGNDYQLENAQSTSGDNIDSLPPPGLCRLVLGQTEQSDNNQPADNTVDEPPPGLNRMVLGSTAFETKKSKAVASAIPMRRMADVFQPADYRNNEEPPAGLHRMVPGESSSPESSSYMYQASHADSAVFQAVNFDDGDNYVSETELNQMGVNLVSQRSATIGADTPPVTTQQITSNTGYSSSSSVDPSISREGAVGIENEHKQSNPINTTDENMSASDNNRRKDIDGGPQDNVGPVRDQTVGQNTTDITPTNSNQQDKHRTRNYTTDSEHEQPKERHNRSSSPGGGRYDKDRRYYDDRRDRPRDRESPDKYRSDRKYDKRRQKDRRYEEDTDYYSDKERSERRHRDDREEYERRYSSLRRDKDKDRRRERGDRRDYEREDRRGDYYYGGRYDEEYYNMPNRSRPSSRTDSMHESYRERNIRPHDREHDRTRNRDRDRDRDRDHHRRTRDPYNPYYQGYNYDPYSPYYQQYQYQYYENLRRTNPQAYAEWYRKYYASQGGAAPHAPGYSTEDRASVHSGRSSANEELNKDRYTRQSYYSQQSLPHYYRENFREIPNASTVYTVDDSRLLDHTDSSLNLEDTNVASQRLTPAKFSTAHVKASIASGNLINILPHYPLDGQPATLEIINLQSLLLDDEVQKELSEFPGPLTKGTTHKKTVIDYCETKIKRAHGNTSIADVESYVLMWELLILLLRQNGMVVGTDIAELLMKNRSFEHSRRQSVSSASSTQHLDTLGEHSDHGARVSPSIQCKEEYITDKFREYLIYGSGKEALEWAMKHGLWGHALFLASKLDKRTYANVMMRFANGLTMNDPLQTLYQLLSGRQPAAVTCVADEKWGDWRPHLAMILSNTTQRPDLDRKAITTLGDTLNSRGNLYAAHFCYLMAQIEFGRYGAQNVKLVLLGSAQNKPFTAFATNEAIFMTEVYEYACSLSDSAFVIPEFQPYKYLMASRMVDHGLQEKGLLYLERVANSIKQDPSRVQPSLVDRVCQLADRLKYCDPVQDEGDLDNSRVDNSWLSELKTVLNDYNMGLITHQSTTNLASLEPELPQDIKPIIDQQQMTEQQWQQQQQTDYYQPNQQQEQPSWQGEQQQSLDYSQQQQQQINYGENELQQASFDQTNYQEQHYWNQQQQQQPPVWEDNAESTQQPAEEQNQSDYWNSTAQSEPTEVKKESKTDDPLQPQISMPNQSKSKNYFDETGDADESSTKPASPVKPKPVVAQQKPASTGWFGGIFSKLALRPKNQMKLPDDKNPTIVWDSEKKRWVNLEEDNGDVSNELKPPPKMSDMFGNRAPAPGPTSMPPNQPQSFPAQSNPVANIPPAQPNPAPLTNPAPAESPVTAEGDGPKPPSSQPNMFKLGRGRGRNIKNAYVDVFNPGGKPTPKAPLPAPDAFGAVPTNGNQMNFFVPQPIADPNAPTDFLSPQAAATEDNAQLSRWSSASSLSREVQFYMQRSQKTQPGTGPLMYNPNQFSNQQTANRGRYPNH